MKKLNIMSLFICLILTISYSAYAYSSPNFTMSWSFQTFNQPNARQVAINTAEKQDGLIEEKEDPIENFASGLERRLYSSAQRDIVDKIMSEDEVPYGEYEAGNLKISVAEDPQTGEIIVDIYDTVSGDSTTITYSGDEWDNDINW
ncbi:MAG: curli assembly protein CsgF [Halanaerobiales bacterium]